MPEVQRTRFHHPTGKYQRLLRTLGDELDWASSDDWKDVARITKRRLYSIIHGHGVRVGEIPTYSWRTVAGAPNTMNFPAFHSTDLNVTSGMPVLFFMRARGGRYLVDTEGASYTKYVIKVV